jgi:transcriptional regulator with XRE-family HTH domain
MTEARYAGTIVPERVRQLREARRLLQKDLAARLNQLGGLGWSQAKVAKLEGGHRQVTFDEVLLLAAALDVGPLAPFATEPIRVTKDLVLDPYDVALWVRG